MFLGRREKGREAAVRDEGPAPSRLGYTERRKQHLRKTPGKMVSLGRGRGGVFTGRKRKKYSEMRSGSRRFCQVLEGPVWGLGISEAWQ